mmetsp:Transcript_23547/g.37018  ORF Transcript_23547/g.37018 Transcript_23547/m.37018 type:complete len:175 (-) Transcript_23547:85-609(-)
MLARKLATFLRRSRARPSMMMRSLPEAKIARLCTAANASAPKPDEKLDIDYDALTDRFRKIMIRTGKEDRVNFKAVLMSKVQQIADMEERGESKETIEKQILEIEEDLERKPPTSLFGVSLWVCLAGLVAYSGYVLYDIFEEKKAKREAAIASREFRKARLAAKKTARKASKEA